ncbi:unnamed protein product [Staurois parvus]|uniref:Uncharacterized protein n=1 Tax=Staurois parvus TaxID=386267 RepID=A0ABN9EK66_9NEOB|nr:unnamed protein product [Staurois parvus]
MGPLCPCPNSKKTMKKGTRGISWGSLMTPGPRACIFALQHPKNSMSKKVGVQSGAD